MLSSLVCMDLQHIGQSANGFADLLALLTCWPSKGWSDPFLLLLLPCSFALPFDVVFSSESILLVYLLIYISLKMKLLLRTKENIPNIYFMELVRSQ